MTEDRSRPEGEQLVALIPRLPKILRRCADALEQLEDGPADPAVVMHEAANAIEHLLAAQSSRLQELEQVCIPRSIRVLPEMWREGALVLRRNGDVESAEFAESYASQLETCIRDALSTSPQGTKEPER